MKRFMSSAQCAPKRVYLQLRSFGEVRLRERCRFWISGSRRVPLEAPAHALLVGVYLGQGRARNGAKCHIAMIEMDRDAIEIIGPERALLAPFLPIGSEHEVIDDQLGAPVEERSASERAPLGPSNW